MQALSSFKDTCTEIVLYEISEAYNTIMSVQIALQIIVKIV